MCDGYFYICGRREVLRRKVERKEKSEQAIECSCGRIEGLREKQEEGGRQDGEGRRIEVRQATADFSALIYQISSHHDQLKLLPTPGPVRREKERERKKSRACLSFPLFRSHKSASLIVCLSISFFFLMFITHIISNCVFKASKQARAHN